MARDWGNSSMSHRDGLTQDMVSHELDMPDHPSLTANQQSGPGFEVSPGEQMGLNDLDIGF